MERDSQYPPSRSTLSREGSILDYRMARRSIGSNSSHASANEFDQYAEPPTPPYLSSPSAVSSLGLESLMSPVIRKSLSPTTPLRKQPSSSTSSDEPPYFSPASTRIELARRLSQLAQQLTRDDYVDEDALTGQIDMMEKVMATPLRTPARASSSLETPMRSTSSLETPARSRSSIERPLRASSPFQTPLRPSSPSKINQHRCKSSIDMQNLDMRANSDFGGFLVGSPPSSVYRTRFTELSASLLSREHQPPEPTATEMREVSKNDMTVQQAKEIAAEATKLNEELSVVVANLRARQEEADHIQGLLIERAETAAQRIIFLQNRIAYLEQELQDNDGELQHLRICLKAVQIQLPPHPDREIQRCIATFKEDYKALKKKRADRSSVASCAGFDTSQVDFGFSPLRTPFKK